MSENTEKRGGKKGFHLVSIKTFDHRIPFFAEEDFGLGPKASVVIGPNGSGKSRALATVLDQFVDFKRQIC